MPTEPVSHSFFQDLHCEDQPYTEQAKSKLTDVPKASAYRLASSLRHVPSVAIYTLAALAAQDFTHQAGATSVVEFAQLPQITEAGEQVVAATTEQARLAQTRSTVASPESLNVQEFAPLQVPAKDSPITLSSTGEQDTSVPTLESFAPQATRTAIAPPETEVMLARTSVQSERVLSTKGLRTGEARVGEGENASSLSPGVSTSLNSIPQETVTPGQTGEVVGQAVAKPSCLAYAPATPETQTGKVVAQAAPTQFCPPVETLRQTEGLQEELRDLENVKVEGTAQASPALSIYIPTAFGADNNTGFISATFQQRTRYSNVSDGGLGVGIGLGDARKAVGVELSYTAASFGRSRDFGAGGFNAKVHRQFGDGLAVAAGVNGALNLGGPNDFEQSVYGVVSKVFRTREDINLPFSRVAVTAGVGGGQFRTEDTVARKSGDIGVFGNVALRVAQPVSLIAEWSGQDLGFGLSVAPFKNIPLVITPAVRDVVGAGDGPRFVLGTGLAFKF